MAKKLKSSHPTTPKKKKKKRKRTQLKDIEEEKPKGAKLARKGETSLKAKGTSGFTNNQLLKRLL